MLKCAVRGDGAKDLRQKNFWCLRTVNNGNNAGLTRGE